jgi:hypothetical protein
MEFARELIQRKQLRITRPSFDGDPQPIQNAGSERRDVSAMIGSCQR